MSRSAHATILVVAVLALACEPSKPARPGPAEVAPPALARDRVDRAAVELRLRAAILAERRCVGPGEGELLLDPDLHDDFSTHAAAPKAPPPADGFAKYSGIGLDASATAALILASGGGRDTVSAGYGTYYYLRSDDPLGEWCIAATKVAWP